MDAQPRHSVPVRVRRRHGTRESNAPDRRSRPPAQHQPSPRAGLKRSDARPSSNALTPTSKIFAESPQPLTAATPETRPPRVVTQKSGDPAYVLAKTNRRESS